MVQQHRKSSGSVPPKRVPNKGTLGFLHPHSLLVQVSLFLWWLQLLPSLHVHPSHWYHHSSSSLLSKRSAILASATSSTSIPLAGNHPPIFLSFVIPNSSWPLVSMCSLWAELPGQDIFLNSLSSIKKDEVSEKKMWVKIFWMCWSSCFSYLGLYHEFERPLEGETQISIFRRGFLSAFFSHKWQVPFSWRPRVNINGSREGVMAFKHSLPVSWLSQKCSFVNIITRGFANIKIFYSQCRLIH